jgi:next-to-BRCA1 protein 1
VEENKFSHLSPDELDKAVASAVSTFLNGEAYLQKLRETVREEVEKLERSTLEAPVPAPFTAPPADIPQESTDMEAKVTPQSSTYAIYCNACEMNIYDVHYHCSVCDGGDYDLCQACVDRGIHCNDSTHWLIKRMLSATGALVVSTTFIKQKTEQKDPEKEIPEPVTTSLRLTCNSCVVGELPPELYSTPSGY